MCKNNVLFVAYEFPPEGCRGTKRAMKFIRYLIPINYNPIVLTVSNGNYEYHDGSLLSELPPNLTIFKTYTLENLFYRYKYKDSEVRDSRAEKNQMKDLNATRSIILKIYHFIGRFLRIPDSKILWLPFAVLKGMKIINRKKIKIIFASGPSFTNHLIGMLLKKITRKPLVLDFRDAWVSDPAKYLYPWQINIQTILEKIVVKNADRVITTTDGITSDFVKRYGKQKKKFVTITHGYDPADFNNLITKKESSPGSICKIIHSGTLGGERNPKNFLEALGELIKNEPEFKSKLQVIFVGQNTPFRDGKIIQGYIEEYGLKDVVRLTGFLSRKDSLKYMYNSDILLLIIGKVPEGKTFVYGISAKIYDYAFIGKPVLTISEQGATAEMARNLGLGPVIHPDNKDEIILSIKNYYNSFTKGSLNADLNQTIIKQFNYRNLTKKLADSFNEILSNHN